MENQQQYKILAIGSFSFDDSEQQGVIRDFPGEIGKALPEADNDRSFLSAT